MIKTTKILFILFLVMTFIFGLYATTFYRTDCKCKKEKESFENKSCPDMLIKKGNVLLLYNSSEETSSENPIPFFNLDEYINYLEIQKSKGVDCPVLFLQEETTAQGENVYKVRPSPFDLQGGLPSTPNLNEPDQAKIKKVVDASISNPPYNKDQTAGFDSHGQNVGEYTNIDAIHDSTSARKISDNPMDKNWAGTTYTQQMVESGKYVGNEIKKPVFFNPKTVFFPSIPSEHSNPQDIL
tara:strand:- start:3693 stop:4412 length:720 start_codon:yes stop_codon:yes gene_type:complete